jgi:hypothetical protein
VERNNPFYSAFFSFFRSRYSPLWALACRYLAQSKPNFLFPVNDLHFPLIAY